MADATDVLAIPFPEGGDAFSAAIVAALAERLDEAPGVESLTSAQIAALTSAQKPAGRVVYNSTTGKLQVSNGTTFVDVDAAALLLTGGTMTGDIAMGSNKITGLAAATANGDAVRYEQVAASYAIGVRTTGSQALSGATLVSYSSETDPSAMLSSGTFTLPSAGLWLVTGTVVGDTQQTTLGAQLYIEHASNGVAWQAWKDYAASVSVVVVASASDTVKLYANGSGNITNARATVAKIGA